MKKLAIMMLTGALLVGTLAGCGSSATEDTAADNQITSEASANDAAADDSAEADDAAASDFDSSSAISVVSREDGSGTRGAFIELTGVEVKDEAGEKTDTTTVEAIITNSTEVMLTTVAGDDFAIGYASLGSMNDTVKGVTVDGVEATVDNIKDDSYALQRPFNIATNGEVSAVTQDFINFIMSADGQAIIEENGYIAVADDAQSFTSDNSEGKIVVAGSSSVTPVMEKLQEAYLAINTGAEIEIQESDSTTGMTAAIDKTCDIGMASRELKDTETEAGLTATVIAKDGIVVIVNNNNPVENLTTEQIKTIFDGTVTTWSEVE